MGQPKALDVTVEAARADGRDSTCLYFRPPACNSYLAMGLFQLTRVPEMEVMDDETEVEAYSSAAAQSYLEKIDRSFVEHVARLMGNDASGRALDLGCGPGQITIMMAKRWPQM